MCHVEGWQKLGDRWEPRPYIVVKKQHGVPVYVLRQEDGEAERVVHCNLFTQCMFLSVDQVDKARRVVEQDSDAGDAGTEVDAAKDLVVGDMEDKVERGRLETSN